MGRFLGTPAGRGNFDPPASSSGDAVQLYACSCWTCAGPAIIPVAKRGNFRRYEVFGHFSGGTSYCSKMTIQHAGYPGCLCSGNGFGSGLCAGCLDGGPYQDNLYCCMLCSCGWVGDHKCFNSSEQYACAGAIPWVWGCSSGCLTACSYWGMNYHMSFIANNACNVGDREWRGCSSTIYNGDSGYCCIGVRNSWHSITCCGGAPGCMQGMCFSNQDNVNFVISGCTNSSIMIYGYGKLPTA